MNEEIRAIIDAVETAIEINVNGKIDKIHQLLERQNETMDVFTKRVDAHIAEVEPFLRAKEGLRVVRGFLIWVAGGIIAWSTIKNGIKIW